MKQNYLGDQTLSDTPDTLWNTCSGNLVICPLPDGLMAEFHRTHTLNGQTVDCLWFFTDELASDPSLVSVGTAAEGTIFLMCLRKLGVRIGLDEMLAVPRTANALTFIVTALLTTWTQERFLTTLPTQEELALAISRVRAKQHRHTRR